MLVYHQEITLIITSIPNPFLSSEKTVKSWMLDEQTTGSEQQTHDPPSQCSQPWQ